MSSWILYQSGILVKQAVNTSASATATTAAATAPEHSMTMFKDSSGTQWIPVTLSDLRLADTDHDNKLSSDEAAAAGIRLATLTPTGLEVMSLTDKKITEIDLPTGKSKTLSFPESAGAPMKGEVVRLQS